MVAPFAVVLETFVVAVLAAFEAFANAEVAEESLEPVPMLDGSHLPIEVAAQYLRSLVTVVEAEVKYEAGVLVLGTVAAVAEGIAVEVHRQGHHQLLASAFVPASFSSPLPV